MRGGPSCAWPKPPQRPVSGIQSPTSVTTAQLPPVNVRRELRATASCRAAPWAVARGPAGSHRLSAQLLRAHVEPCALQSATSLRLIVLKRTACVVVKHPGRGRSLGNSRAGGLLGTGAQKYLPAKVFDGRCTLGTGATSALSP